MEKQPNLVCDHEAIHEDVVSSVRADMPHNRDFNALANLYKMFSDDTRIKILWALSRHEMCAGDIAVLLDMTKSAISHHMKSLKLTNLVRYDKRGREVYYQLADDHVKDIFYKGFEHIRE
ncbi:metalloregulator ArsR/SmtB family transcription factor [Hydrogenoanaerobacterium sp.]|uniref:ArsR/SmtB family transcription factor n=1 Tax=Clostridia TaxID=186801 RepID=UPI0028976298|nr:metalloregulator ArsR/SmtB family transcription factor [Hydrogenoanaerobacterium sp.]MDK2965764.1 ArsR family transcriptional regulator, lead/cadmium/zinc/bismuth-responsive transcriptional [Lacrimispora sp.]